MAKLKLQLSSITTKSKRKLVLTNKQKEDIWDSRGPYSEVCLIIESRILDEEVWRVWVKVNAVVNPFTFSFVKKHADEFSDDFRVQSILKWGEYNGKERGYFSKVWAAPYTDGVIDAANDIYQQTEDALIRMHKFVINNFDININ